MTPNKYTVERTSRIFKGESLACRRGGRTVFSNLSFSIASGEALVLVGPNGSGKSTLLRLMAGLLSPESGTLAWNGRSIEDDQSHHRATLCYAGHLDAVKPTQTVLDNLTFWARARGVDAGAVATVCLDALSRFGLEPLAEFPSHLLSAGQKRRLGLARLLLAPTDLWLLDEPTVALDASSVDILAGVIDRHRESGGRLAISTHGRWAEKGGLEGARYLKLAEYPPSNSLDGE